MILLILLLVVGLSFFVGYLIGQTNQIREDREFFEEITMFRNLQKEVTKAHIDILTQKLKGKLKKIE